jgi:hypothetical protein
MKHYDVVVLVLCGLNLILTIAVSAVAARMAQLQRKIALLERVWRQPLTVDADQRTHRPISPAEWSRRTTSPFPPDNAPVFARHPRRREVR